jgi:hypothetical protein
METFAHNARGLGNCHVQNVMVMDIIYVQIVRVAVVLVAVVIAAIATMAIVVIVVMVVTMFRLGINLHALNVKEKNMSLSCAPTRIVITA